jgi:hypothetical protein
MRWSVLAILLFLHAASALWLAERYDYPKENVMEVVKYGVERGGSFKIEVSYRQVVNVPLSLFSRFPWPRDKQVWPGLESGGIDVLICEEEVLKEALKDSSIEFGLQSKRKLAMCQRLDKLRDCSVMARISPSSMREIVTDTPQNHFSGSDAPSPNSETPSQWYELVGHAVIGGSVGKHWSSASTLSGYWENGAGPGLYSLSLLSCPLSLSHFGPFTPHYNSSIPSTPSTSNDTEIPENSQSSASFYFPLQPILGEMQLISVRGWFINQDRVSAAPPEEESIFLTEPKKETQASSRSIQALEGQDLHLNSEDYTKRAHSKAQRDRFSRTSETASKPHSSFSSHLRASNSAETTFVHSAYATSTRSPLFVVHVVSATFWAVLLSLLLGNTLFFGCFRIPLLAWKKSSPLASLIAKSRKRTQQRRTAESDESFLEGSEGTTTLLEPSWESTEQEDDSVSFSAGDFVPTVHIIMRLVCASFLFYNIYLIMCYRDLHVLGYVSFMGILNRPKCANNFFADPLYASAPLPVQNYTPNNFQTETTFFKWTEDPGLSKLHLLASLSCSSPSSILNLVKSAHFDPSVIYTGETAAQASEQAKLSNWESIAVNGFTPAEWRRMDAMMAYYDGEKMGGEGMWPGFQWLLFPILPSLFLAFSTSLLVLLALYISKGGSLTRSTGLSRQEKRKIVTILVCIFLALFMASLSSDLSKTSRNHSNLYPLPRLSGMSWWNANKRSTQLPSVPSPNPPTASSAKPEVIQSKMPIQGGFVEEKSSSSWDFRSSLLAADSIYSSSILRLAPFSSKFSTLLGTWMISGEMSMFWSAILYALLLIATKECLSSGAIVSSYLKRQLALVDNQINQNNPLLPFHPHNEPLIDQNPPETSEDPQRGIEGRQNHDQAWDRDSSTISPQSGSGEVLGVPIDVSVTNQRIDSDDISDSMSSPQSDLGNADHNETRREAVQARNRPSYPSILVKINRILMRKMEVMRRSQATIGIAFAIFSLLAFVSPFFSASKHLLLNSLFQQLIAVAMIGAVGFSFLLSKSSFKHFILHESYLKQQSQLIYDKNSRRGERNESDKKQIFGELELDSSGLQDEENDDSHIGIRLDELKPSHKQSNKEQIGSESPNSQRSRRSPPRNQNLDILHEASLLADDNGVLSEESKRSLLLSQQRRHDNHASDHVDAVFAPKVSNPSSPDLIKAGKPGRSKKHGSSDSSSIRQPPSTLIVIYPPSTTFSKSPELPKAQDSTDSTVVAPAPSLASTLVGEPKTTTVVPLHPKLAAKLNRSSPLPPSMSLPSTSGSPGPSLVATDSKALTVIPPIVAIATLE